MKKVLISVMMVSLFSFASAGFKGQLQAGASGYGLGVGADVLKLPLLMDIGVEYQAGTFGSYTQNETFTDEGTGLDVNADATLAINTKRYGMYLDMKSPGLKNIPVIGFLFSPVIHFGAQEWDMSLDGTARMPGVNATLGTDERKTAYGSYFILGYPMYFGPFYSELGFGTQHIAVKGIGQATNQPDVQWSLGFSFL